MKNLILLCTLIFISVGCSKDSIQIDPHNLLIGIWNYSGSNDNINIYKRSSEFTNNQCYKFNGDGTMTERKISGWCGTPPVSYADYPGTWTIINDTLIQINDGYWGGTTSYKLNILTKSLNTLKVSYIPGDN